MSEQLEKRVCLYRFLFVVLASCYLQWCVRTSIWYSYWSQDASVVNESSSGTGRCRQETFVFHQALLLVRRCAGHARKNIFGVKHELYFVGRTCTKDERQLGAENMTSKSNDEKNYGTHPQYSHSLLEETLSLPLGGSCALESLVIVLDNQPLHGCQRGRIPIPWITG